MKTFIQGTSRPAPSFPDSNFYICRRCGAEKRIGGNGNRNRDVCADCKPYEQTRTSTDRQKTIQRYPCFVPCERQDHDHSTDEGMPLYCLECGEPAHFDFLRRQFRHDDPDIDRHGGINHLIA